MIFNTLYTTVVLAVLAAPALCDIQLAQHPSQVVARSFNPPPEAVVEDINIPNAERDLHGWESREYEEEWTNSERFARGLPPAKPRHAGAKREEAAKAAPSKTARSSHWQHAYISMKDASGNHIGYLSPRWNMYGEYGRHVVRTKDAMEVGFRMHPTGSTGDVKIHVYNPRNYNFPLLGAVSGYNSSYNFKHGELSYAPLAGVQWTPKDTPPTVDIPNSFSAATKLKAVVESHVWSYVASTKQFVPQWTNQDLGKPTTYIMLSDNVLLLTGDVALFQKEFKNSKPVTLHAVYTD